MNQDQSNITTMHGTVADYMNQNQPVWSGVKAVSDTVAALAANNSVITTKANTQETATDGAAETKRQAKHDLEEKILEVSDQLGSLAAKTGNVALEAQTHLTQASLDALTDDELPKMAGNIGALATANLTALADYNVTAADVSALTTLATNFGNVKTAPRTAIAERSAQTKTLPQAISDNQSLLRRQLDKQMTKFKKTSPEFYAGYQSARVVVSRRSHHKGVQPAPQSQTQK